MPLLSIVAPTYNESSNLPVLCERIFTSLKAANIDGELIIVDDNSPDGTAELAQKLAEQYPVRVIKRAGKLGLSSAVIEGWKAATGKIVGVIDADLSHDPNILPDMVYSITNGGAELALGSRYIPGGGVCNWPWRRRITSLAACWMGRPLCPAKDVTSGYMMFNKYAIEGVDLDPIGFKINLEVLIKGRYETFTEVPFTFVDRQAGQSKMSGKEITGYLIQLCRLAVYWLKNRPKHRRVSYTKHPLCGQN